LNAVMFVRTSSWIFFSYAAMIAIADSENRKNTFSKRAN